MKIILVVFLLVSIGACFNKECAVAVAKLSVTSAKLYADIQTGNVFAIARDTALVTLQAKKVKESCYGEVLFSQSDKNLPPCFSLINDIYQSIGVVLEHISHKNIQSLQAELPNLQTLIKKALENCKNLKEYQLDQETSERVDCQAKAMAMVADIQEAFRQTVNVNELNSQLLKKQSEFQRFQVDCKFQQPPEQLVPKAFLGKLKVFNQDTDCYETYTSIRRLGNLDSEGIFSQLSETIDKTKLLSDQCTHIMNTQLRTFKECYDHSYRFGTASKAIIQKTLNGQDILDSDFIDEVERTVLEIDPLLTACNLTSEEQKWVSILPETCVHDLTILAHDGTKLRDDKDKPIQYAKDLIKFYKDYSVIQTECPFFKN